MRAFSLTRRSVGIPKSRLSVACYFRPTETQLTEFTPEKSKTKIGSRRSANGVQRLSQCRGARSRSKPATIRNRTPRCSSTLGLCLPKSYALIFDFDLKIHNQHSMVGKFWSPSLPIKVLSNLDWSHDDYFSRTRFSTRNVPLVV